MVQLTLQADSCDEIIDLMWKMGLKLDHHLRKGNNSVTLTTRGVPPEEETPTAENAEQEDPCTEGKKQRRKSPKILKWEQLCEERGVHPVAVGRKSVHKICEKCGNPFYGYSYSTVCDNCKTSRRKLRPELPKIEPAVVDAPKPKVVVADDHKCVRCRCDLPDGRLNKLCDSCQKAIAQQEAERRKAEAAERDAALAAEEEARQKKEMAKNKFKVCPRCGRSFEPSKDYPFFCQKCTDKARKAKPVPPLKKD